MAELVEPDSQTALARYERLRRGETLAPPTFDRRHESKHDLQVRIAYLELENQRLRAGRGRQFWPAT